MSPILQNKQARRAKTLRFLSLILTIIALLPALALFAYDVFLYKIMHPAIVPSPGPAALIPLPITGWQALAIQGGPVVLIFLALMSVLLDVIGRWQARQSQLDQGSSTLPPETARSPAMRRPKRWGFSTWLALLPIVLGLLAPMPASWVFDTGGDTFLDSVAMTSPSDGWAVGAFLKNVGGYYGVIWHYHNGKWAPVSSPTQSWLRAVTALPDGEAWAVGSDGAILHEHGGQWAPVESGTTDDLYGVAMVSPNEGWAVGGAYDIPIALSGSGPASSGAVHALFNSRRARSGITAIPQDHITCRILHYTNGQWHPTACPASEPLQSVVVLPDGEAWAVGMDGIILHERQGSWSQVPSPTHKRLNSVALASPTEGWAVGDQGTILHDQQGTWTLVPALTSWSLASVAVAASGEGWIVGDGNTILYESQGTWTPAPSPIHGVFFAVTLLPDGQEGWVVGADQPILHEENGIWSVYAQQVSG